MANKYKIFLTVPIIFLVLIVFGMGFEGKIALDFRDKIKDFEKYGNKTTEIYFVEIMEQAEKSLNQVKYSYNQINEDEGSYFFNKRSKKFNNNRLEIFLKRHFRPIEMQNINTMKISFYNYDREGRKSGKIILDHNLDSTYANIYDMVNKDGCENPDEIKIFCDNLLMDSDTDASNGLFYISLCEEPQMKMYDATNFKKYPLGKYNRVFWVSRKIPNANSEQSLTIAIGLLEKDFQTAFHEMFEEGERDLYEMQSMFDFILAFSIITCLIFTLIIFPIIVNFAHAVGGGKE